jgi:hypothetical protein
MDDEWFCKKLAELDNICRLETGDIRAAVAEIVDTYQYESCLDDEAM